MANPGHPLEAGVGPVPVSEADHFFLNDRIISCIGEL